MRPGDIISYRDMCDAEGSSLQRGMNYRLKNNYSVVLMSVRTGAPYADMIQEEGKVIIYEGHDASGVDNPKKLDQPLLAKSGTNTQNGHFMQAASDYKKKKRSPEHVKVYEKVRSGIWVYNGIYLLTDAWIEVDGIRNVCKFKLELVDDDCITYDEKEEIQHSRVIPTHVKQKVWKRDQGRCVKCGSNQNLHFDHIIPYVKGGASITEKNIQLLCARCNLEKHDKIE